MIDIARERGLLVHVVTVPAVENAIRTGHHHIEFEDDGGFSGDYQED
jgi:hypothetical protein